MKKFTILIAAFALVAFSVPAMAADWNFYGSARINTWYVSTDLGDATVSGTANEDGDSQVRWGFNGQTNSRLGARVKAENISGRVEIQLKGYSSGDPGNSVTVESRILYGEWNFGAGKLKIGKDYTPVSQFISGQVFDEDLGLLGIGTQYGNRTPGMFFMFGGFEVALLDPNATRLTGMSTTPIVSAVDPVTGVVSGSTTNNGDVDSYIPKIEAKWGMSFDAWNFGLQGGYQYYSIEDVLGTSGRNDIGVTSYTIGGDAGFNFGPGYVKAALSYGQNWGNAAWGLNGAYTGGSNANWDLDDGTDDTDSFQGTLVAGLKMSDMLSFEGGFGYRQDDPDVSGQDKQKAWSAYVQSVVVMAPGVYIIPEAGYFDYGDNFDGTDAGNAFYLGAKWQIDF